MVTFLLLINSIGSVQSLALRNSVISLLHLIPVQNSGAENLSVPLLVPQSVTIGWDGESCSSEWISEPKLSFQSQQNKMNWAQFICKSVRQKQCGISNVILVVIGKLLYLVRLLLCIWACGFEIAFGKYSVSCAIPLFFSSCFAESSA